jgi:hypothetical protein
MFKYISIEPKPYDLEWSLDGLNSADINAEVRLAKAAPALLQALRRARGWVAMYEHTKGHDAAAKAMLEVIDKAIEEAI